MTKEWMLKAIGLVALVWLTSVLPARAQADGRFAGTVQDASGAFLPSATVTVKNEKTGEERTHDDERARPLRRDQPQAVDLHDSRSLGQLLAAGVHRPAAARGSGIPSRPGAETSRRHRVGHRSRHVDPPSISARRGLASTSASAKC